MSRDWETVSYVISSTYRREVVAVLAEGPATPSSIADETDNSMAHVSTALTDLRDHEVVELLVPESRRKGRVYGLTEAGEAAWAVISEENL